jgi:hypothetical protein
LLVTKDFGPPIGTPEEAFYSSCKAWAFLYLSAILRRAKFLGYWSDLSLRSHGVLESKKINHFVILLTQDRQGRRK